MFAERLKGFEEHNVRIAGTHTLRQANNAHLFLQRAREVIPFPIEIIPGEEEARLIYQGVAHTQVESGSKLVIDIGGGSTELIVGSGFEPTLLSSKRMGCVSYTEHYFKNGKLSKKNFAKAILAAEQKLESIVSKFKKKGWDMAFGSSGTIKAVREVLFSIGYDDGVVTLKRVEKLIERLCEWDNIDDIKLDGLTNERKPVFAAGVAILCAILKDLNISKLYFSEGALREGLLYEMEERLQRSDIRMRTTENLAVKHFVDLEHANKVKQQAVLFLKQVQQQLELKEGSELFDLLEWSALLHEVGLSISLQGFHKHSAYILKHTNMPGFNQEQQRVLATLARFQRKALKLNEMEQFSLFKQKHVIGLIQVLRLAILVNGQRHDEDLIEFNLSCEEGSWTLSSPSPNWQEEHKLLLADLTSEKEYWYSAGWTLNF